ncbi:hypothetical protein OROHE_002766 [Orobanche hederae]
MSNTIGNNLPRQILLSPTVLEHQIRRNSRSCIGGNSFSHPQANSLIHRSSISAEFLGNNRLILEKKNFQMGKQRAITRSFKAVLAADPSSSCITSDMVSKGGQRNTGKKLRLRIWAVVEIRDAVTFQKIGCMSDPMLWSASRITSCNRVVKGNDFQSYLTEKFNLDKNIELQTQLIPINIRITDANKQVDVGLPTSGSALVVNMQVTSSSASMLLHWGAIGSQKEKWILPHRRPVGTMLYKNKALRSPFMKSGSKAVLKIEIDDPAIQALEFLIFDEAQNIWYKYDGGNFHVKLPKAQSKGPLNVSVPEDLVQLQAYLRWERKGKRSYTPEKEKEEYEAARMELLEEVAKGTSLEDLRKKFTTKNDTSETEEKLVSTPKSNIPDDLVQIQSYIRWERAGKPNYSPEQQLREFEEARKELQVELENGASLEEIRKKLTKGEIQTKVSKQFENKRYFNVERIQRKKRDLMLLLTKFGCTPVEENISSLPEVLSTVEQFSRAIEDRISGSIMNKKIYKHADKELLILVAKQSGKTKVYLATDLPQPVVLHWGLSKRPGEWEAPPSTILPSNSISLGNAAETKLTTSSSDNHPGKVQSLEITIEDDKFVGMPFVLLSGGNWVKDRGSDFYVELNTGPTEIQKKDLGDGRGTSKSLLDKIAELESEAQKSFMHR